MSARPSAEIVVSEACYRKMANLLTPGGQISLRAQMIRFRTEIFEVTSISNANDAVARIAPLRIEGYAASFLYKNTWSFLITNDNSPPDQPLVFEDFAYHGRDRTMIRYSTYTEQFGHPRRISERLQATLEMSRTHDTVSQRPYVIISATNIIRLQPAGNS